MDSSIIDKNVIHFEISSLAVIISRKFDESVLQRLIRAPIPDNFGRFYISES